MDFVIKLLKSTDLVTNLRYNSILVIINRLTKYLHFILYNKTINAKQLSCLVINRLVRNHRLLATFIINKDKLFTLNY